MFSVNAQTKEELHAQKAEKQAIADAAQGEANALQAQLMHFQVGEKVLLVLLVVTYLTLATGILKVHQTTLREL